MDDRTHTRKLYEAVGRDLVTQAEEARRKRDIEEMIARTKQVTAITREYADELRRQWGLTPRRREQDRDADAIGTGTSRETPSS